MTIGENIYILYKSSFFDDLLDHLIRQNTAFIKDVETKIQKITEFHEQMEFGEITQLDLVEKSFNYDMESLEQNLEIANQVRPILTFFQGVRDKIPYDQFGYFREFFHAHIIKCLTFKVGD